MAKQVESQIIKETSYCKSYNRVSIKDDDGKNSKALSRELGYSERWLTYLMDLNANKNI